VAKTVRYNYIGKVLKALYFKQAFPLLFTGVLTLLHHICRFIMPAVWARPDFNGIVNLHFCLFGEFSALFPTVCGGLMLDVADRNMQNL
jgi:hypothetical protein